MSEVHLRERALGRSGSRAVIMIDTGTVSVDGTSTNRTHDGHDKGVSGASETLWGGGRRARVRGTAGSMNAVTIDENGVW